jgi:prepilin-type N-terminal cleavage/methylation domain-containing protein
MSDSLSHTPMPTLGSNRRGMSLPELLIVVVIAAALFAIAVPKIGAARDGASRRAARQELSAAFAATRAAALQKGKTATLTLTSTSATVAVQSGLAGNAVTVWGPIRFDKSLSATIEALNGAPTSVSYNARGLLTPTPVGTQKYRVTVGALRDTVCISPAGIILPKGCQL